MIAIDRPARPSADDALLEALALLECCGVRHAVVRPPARDGRGVLEADVLVAPADRITAERALVAVGFRRRPGWGRDPHRFFLRPVVARSGEALDWLKLDVVTDLAFGPWHQWRAHVGHGCLLERRPGPPARLDPADEMAALIAHVLVDRGVVRPSDSARLRALATAAPPAPGVVGRAVLPPDGPLAWVEVRRAAREGTVGDLLPHAGALRRHLRGRHPLEGCVRHLRNRALRRARALLQAVSGPAPLVALVGPDGTGKSTLASAVVADGGLPARVLYGGTYTSGTRAHAVPGVATGIVFSRLLRTRAAIAWHRRRGRVVVLDRHPAEAAPVRGDTLALRTRLRRRGLAATLPRPDLLLVLDAPAEVLHSRRPEHTVAHLEDDRRRHLAMTVRTRTDIVDATGSPTEVRDHAVDLLWRHAVPTGVRTRGATGG